MATIIIERPLEEILGDLNAKIEYLKENNERDKLRELKFKRRALLNYKKKQDSKTEFEKHLYLKFHDKERWFEKCKELTKDVKYVYFDTKRELFRAQKRINGKTKYIGEFDSIDDAKEIVESFFN